MMTDLQPPRVFLGMPMGAAPHPDVAASWYTPTWACDRRKIAIAERREIRMSSIVGGFNYLWGRALDLRDKGQVTHFAMQHADVEPTSWWLDDLYSLMLVRNVSLISAVVAIKDHGRTRVSAGTAARSDPYRRHTFTFEELEALPQTFTSDNLPADQFLLINTGLWLCDLRDPAWDDFAFVQAGRFVRDVAGAREWQLMPEDWHLAQWMTERGIRYAATRSIEVKHHGSDWWTNHREAGHSCREAGHSCLANHVA